MRSQKPIKLILIYFFSYLLSSMSYFCQLNNCHSYKQEGTPIIISPSKKKRNYEEYISANLLLDFKNITEAKLLSEANLLLELKRKKIFLGHNIKQVEYERLVMIKHSLNCRIINCPVKFCKPCKQLINHIRECDNKDCQTPFCCTTRVFINRDYQRRKKTV